MTLRLPALTLSTVLAMLATVVPPARAADPFYADLLRDGIHAYDRGELALAARDLRLACFGLIEEPKPLAACLARLALAQERSGDLDGFRDTFRRLVELEERFQAYSQAELPPELRAALEQRLAARIPAPTLAGSPAPFRAIATARKGGEAEKPPAKKPAAAAAPPKGERSAVAKAPAERAPTPVATPPPARASGTAGTARTAGAPEAVKPSPPAPAAPRPLTEEERGKLATARRLLAESGKSKDLKLAFDLAHEVADAHPDAVEAQHLAGEAAYRLSRWSDAALYLRRGGGPPDGEPELLFYLAVALYESGDAAGAATALKRSLPNLQRTPYIEAYARKILGQ